MTKNRLYRPDYEVAIAKAYTMGFKHLSTVGMLSKAAPIVDPAQVTENAIQYAINNAGDLITSADAAEQTAIGQIIANGMDLGLSEDQMAAQISNIAGLDPRYAQAVSNRYNSMLDQGYSVGDANDAAQAYSDQLAYGRALMIANTETASAINEGQRDAVEQAVQEGDLPEGTTYRWTTNPAEGTCSDCYALDGEIADDNGDYPGSDGPPPYHPNCQCTEEPVLPSSDGS